MEHFIVEEISRYGYQAIFGLMVLESAGIPIPSEAIMGFGGALTTGFIIAGVNGHLNFWAVAIAGAVGNLVGAIIAYLIGRTGGRAIVERYGKYFLIRPHDLDKSEAFFNKRGNLAVLVGRILPVVRTYISFPAGIAEMPIYRFGLFTLLGSLPWTIGLAYIGRTLAVNWSSLAKAATPISVVFALALIAFIVRWYLKRRTFLRQI